MIQQFLLLANRIMQFMILSDKYPTALWYMAHSAQIVTAISEEVDGMVRFMVSEKSLKLVLFTWSKSAKWQPALIYLW